MAHFVTKLRMEVADFKEDGQWVLIDPLVYQSDIIGAVAVPEGFKTDLASVPRVPIVYLATGGVVREAAVIHDYLYQTGQVKRATADAVFKEAMAVSGIPAWQREAMYWAVRAFGWQFYKKDRK